MIWFLRKLKSADAMKTKKTNFDTKKSSSLDSSSRRPGRRSRPLWTSSTTTTTDPHNNTPFSFSLLCHWCRNHLRQTLTALAIAVILGRSLWISTHHMGNITSSPSTLSSSSSTISFLSSYSSTFTTNTINTIPSLDQETLGSLTKKGGEEATNQRDLSDSVSLPPPPMSSSKDDALHSNHETTARINFVHIPRAAGTTIEQLSLHFDHECGMWGSRKIGNATHRQLYGPGGPAYQYVANIPHSNHNNDTTKRTTTCKCPEWHVPPALLDEATRQILYPASQTFCLFRHPLQRLISDYYLFYSGPSPVSKQAATKEFKYQRGPCFDDSAQHMNDIILRDLQHAFGGTSSEQAATTTTTTTYPHPCWAMCHYLPQTEYFKGHEQLLATAVSDSNNDDNNIKRQCDEIILLDDQWTDHFDALMEKIDCPIRFPNREGNSNSSNKFFGDFVPAHNVNKDVDKMCQDDPALYDQDSDHGNAHLRGKRIVQWNIQDLSPAVLELAHKVYAKDLALYEQLSKERNSTLTQTALDRLESYSKSEALYNGKPVGKINFLHIPKAGGTTIEMLGKKSNHRCGLWGSRMVGNDTFKEIHGGWGPFYSHKSESSLGSVKPCACAEWHMPPALLNTTLRAELYPAEKTFCLFRDPLDKLVSYYYYHHSGPKKYPNETSLYVSGPCFNASAAHMNEILRNELKAHLDAPCFRGCHTMPQHEFFKGHENLVAKYGLAGPEINKQCDEIILLDENMESNFDQLMERINCPIRFGTFSAKNVKESRKCKDDRSLYQDHNAHLQGQPFAHLTSKDLSPEVLELAHQIYGKDIELFERMSKGENITELKASTSETKALWESGMVSTNAVSNLNDTSLNVGPAGPIGKINFVHIPKAGGTTIEKISIQNNHKCGLWGSRMIGNQTFRSIHGPWGPFYMHESKSTLGGRTKCRCAEWHMPPALLNDSLRDELYPAEKTFCLFRDPLEKLVSYYYYHHSGPLKVGSDQKPMFVEGPCFNTTAAHMNEVLLGDLNKLLEYPCFKACHALAQHEYFKGYEDKVAKYGVSGPSHNKQCDEILLLDEHLPSKFDQLMEQIHCPIRFGDINMANAKENRKCKDDETLYQAHNLHLKGQPYQLHTVQDLSPEVRALANQIYGKDIELYEKLSQAQRTL